MKIKSTNSENIKSIVDPQDKPKTAEPEKANTSSASQTSAGVGSIKSKFEMAQSPTTLDKMFEGKILQADPSDRYIRMAPSPESKWYGWSTKFRESAGKVGENSLGSTQDANQKLTPDQFSVNEKGQVVVQQKQIADSLNAHTEKSGMSPEAKAYEGLGRPVADKTQSESHIWMNAATKRSFGKSPEVEAFVIDGVENQLKSKVREDGSVRFTNKPMSQIIDPEDRPVADQIINPEDFPVSDQIVEPEDLPADFQKKVREDRVTANPDAIKIKMK